MSNTKKILTTGDIATHCQVCYETVANWIKSDKLKSYQTPGRNAAFALRTLWTFSRSTACLRQRPVHRRRRLRSRTAGRQVPPRSDYPRSDDAQYRWLPSLPTRARQSHTRHIGILVITGYAAEENVKRAMECGADSWMAKPFDPSELIQKVESVLAASDKRAKNISLTA